jgi:hypothetical protein
VSVCRGQLDERARAVIVRVSAVRVALEIGELMMSRSPIFARMDAQNLAFCCWRGADLYIAAVLSDA